MQPPDREKELRRELLSLTDDLLQAVEERRMHDQHHLDPELTQRLIQVATRVGFGTGDPRVLRRLPPHSLDDAHNQLFLMQIPVLRGAQVELGSSTDRREVRLPEGGQIVQLRRRVFPFPTETQSLQDYHEEIRITIQRAYDAVRLYEIQAEVASTDSAAILQARAADAQENLRELIDRSRAVLPDRYRPIPPAAIPRATILRLGPLVLDVDAGQLTHASERVKLTPTQQRYVGLLVANHGRWVTHEALLATHPERPQDHNRVLRAQISQARRKLPQFMEIAGREGAYRLSTPHPLELGCGLQGGRRELTREKLAWLQRSQSDPGPSPSEQAVRLGLTTDNDRDY